MIKFRGNLCSATSQLFDKLQAVEKWHTMNSNQIACCWSLVSTSKQLVDHDFSAHQLDSIASNDKWPTQAHWIYINHIPFSTLKDKAWCMRDITWGTTCWPQDGQLIQSCKSYQRCLCYLFGMPMVVSHLMSSSNSDQWLHLSSVWLTTDKFNTAVVWWSSCGWTQGNVHISSPKSAVFYRQLSCPMKSDG